MKSEMLQAMEEIMASAEFKARQAEWQRARDERAARAKLPIELTPARAGYAKRDGQDPFYVVQLLSAFQPDGSQLKCMMEIEECYTKRFSMTVQPHVVELEMSATEANRLAKFIEEETNTKEWSISQHCHIDEVFNKVKNSILNFSFSCSDAALYFKLKFC